MLESIRSIPPSFFNGRLSPGGQFPSDKTRMGLTRLPAHPTECFFFRIFRMSLHVTGGTRDPPPHEGYSPQVDVRFPLAESLRRFKMRKRLGIPGYIVALPSGSQLHLVDEYRIPEEQSPVSSGA